MKHLKYHSIIVVILLLAGAISSSCQNTPKTEPKSTSNKLIEKPNLSSSLDSFLRPLGYVSDYENLYMQSEIYTLDSLLHHFEKEIKLQVVLVTLDSSLVSSSEFDKVVAVLGNGWKVGGDSSFGIVVGISATNQRIRIENGYKARPFISDDETQNIIANHFIPDFKNAEFFKGTFSGISALLQLLRINLEKRTKVTF